MPLSSNARIVAWAGALGIYLVLLPFWLPTVIAAFESAPLLPRVLVSLAVVLPCGLLMGFGFPAGMRLVNAIDAAPTPWFWAVNGASGVLAASLAVATSIAFSINTSLWIGAACYLAIAPVGVALASLSRWPSIRHTGTHAVAHPASLSLTPASRGR